MKKRFLSAIALCLVLSMLLCGCNFVDFKGYFDRVMSLMDSQTVTSFDQMAYTRPDMDALEDKLDQCLELAASSQSVQELIGAVQEYYVVYNSFYTNYALANIYYCQDMTSSKWETEYSYCMDSEAQATAGLDKLYRALAVCPLRDQLEGEDYFGKDFFLAYEGDGLYDEVFTGYLAEESALVSQYYAVSAQANQAGYDSDAYNTQYADQLAEIYVELIRVRQKIAAHAGYESYPEYAYDYYYGRDYTCQQTESYLNDIQNTLVPLYQQLLYGGGLDISYGRSSQKQTLDYLRTMATAMGGKVEQAFQTMETGGLYDISYGANKFNGSFEVYLTSYNAPFIFMNPSETEYDKLTLAHEFGHFCGDYISMGSAAGTDVQEIFSQGMEYLSLCYVSDSNLKKLKMADCLDIYISQSLYTSFELQVYSLQGADLTKENVEAIYADALESYGLSGLGLDTRDYVSVSHFFTSPMYIISYVVSNDVALQLYQMEQDNAGSGLSCLTDSMISRQSGLHAYIQEAGIPSSPFDPGRLEAVRDTLEAILA